MQVTALIGGTDQEHPHVALPRRRQGRIVVLADVIPMHVDVIKDISGNGIEDQIERAMGGKADVTDGALPLPAF